MKKSISLFILTLFLFSCTEVIFEEPQPPGVNALNKMPKEIQGNFSFVLLNEETMMEIGSDYMTNDEEKAYISDSLVVKNIGKKYVVSKRLSEGEGKIGKWQVYVLEDKGCGFVKATSFIVGSDTYLEKFKETYNATQIGQGQEKSLIIAPNASQFNTILEDDSVTMSVILERIK
ncbi:MAG: hypothetical protein ABFS32_07675 [Bacteroidota bacterium]